MKPLWRKCKILIINFLRERTNLVKSFTIDLCNDPNWSDCVRLQWDSYSKFDDAFYQHFYSSDMGKWLLDYPWHVVSGIGNISISNQNVVFFTTIQISFLKKADAAMFRLRAGV